MKTHELFEGRLRNGYYDYGYHPTSRDKGLAHWYNNVRPALSRTFDIPVANFKAQSDHGFGWHAGKMTGLYSPERVIMHVYLRHRKLDVDLIKQMLPKALKAELSKQLADVRVSEAELLPATEMHAPGQALPQRLEIRFSTKYPQEWLDHDKQRYNINWN